MSRKKQTLRERTQWVALCGLLVALMLVLGFVESLMPVAAGMPGIKLGLSNGVLIFAVYMLNLPTAFVLMVLKVLLSGLLFGGVNAMMYAFAGGLVSMVFMALLKPRARGSSRDGEHGGRRGPQRGPGGAGHGVLSTPSLMYYMAVLMVAGPDHGRGHRRGSQPCDEASCKNPQIV